MNYSFSNREHLILAFILTLPGLLSVTTHVSAQTHNSVTVSQLDGLPVRTISVHGLQRMDEDVVLRRMELKAGSRYMAEKARRDERAITGLMIFWSVRIEATGVPERGPARGVDIKVHLEERFAWFAFPRLEWKQEEGWSYGAAAGHFNIAHRGHWFYLSGLLGGARYLSASISNSWNGSHHESFHIGGAMVQIQNQLYDFRENGERISLRFGRWFGSQGRGGVELLYRRIEGKLPEWKGPVAGTPFQDRIVMFSATLGLDTSDPWAYPRIGRISSLSLEQCFSTSGRDLNSGAARGWASRHFRLRKDLVLVSYGLIETLWGDVPFWRLLTLGGQNSLRGYEIGTYLVNRRWEATGELQWHVMPPLILNLGALGDQITGVTLTVFAEAGAGNGVQRGPGTGPWENRSPLLASWGTGVNFYNALFGTLRCELAWPDEGPCRLGFALGTKF